MLGQRSSGLGAWRSVSPPVFSVRREGLGAGGGKVCVCLLSWSPLSSCDAGEHLRRSYLGLYLAWTSHEDGCCSRLEHICEGLVNLRVQVDGELTCAAPSLPQSPREGQVGTQGC